MRKTYLLCCTLEVLILKSFEQGLEKKIMDERSRVCKSIRESGKRAIREIGSFLLRYEPPLGKTRQKFEQRLIAAWCSVLNGLREHHNIQGSYPESPINLNAWSKWARNISLA